MKKLNIKESANIYKNWADTGHIPTLEDNIELELDTEYQILRKDIVAEYKKQKELNTDKYSLDANMSLWFYKYMKEKSWFNDRLASDEDFWRYIAMCVIPDVITDRFPNSDKRHYYSKGTRIYPYTAQMKTSVAI